MRRKMAVLFAIVSTACALEILFADEIISPASTVKASTATEDFTIIACSFAPPTLEEVIFGLTLLFTPIFMLAVIIERGSMHYKASKQIKAFKANEHAAARDFLAAGTSEKQPGESKNHIAEVVIQALGRSAAPDANLSRPRIQIEQARQRAVALKRVEFEERLWIIAAIAITMPLFSLIGPLMGLTEAFQNIIYNAVESTWPIVYSLRAMTELLMWGLGVSIPAFWMHRLFTSKAKKLTSQLDEASARLLDLVLNYQPRPWLLESKSSADTYATQDLSRSTSAFTSNRQE